MKGKSYDTRKMDTKKKYVKRIHELQKTFGGERNVENW